MFAASGPLILRVGGDSADQSFWDPQSLPMPQWAFTIAPSWLDQARRLVRRLGVKLILDLNLITDSPPTATAMGAGGRDGPPPRQHHRLRGRQRA